MTNLSGAVIIFRFGLAGKEGEVLRNPGVGEPKWRGRLTSSPLRTAYRGTPCLRPATRTSVKAVNLAR